MRLISWLVVLPLAVFSAFFAVSNRNAVTLNFDPIPYTLTLPLFASVLGAILIGIFVGGVATWMRQSKWRRETKDLKRQSQKLEEELEQVRAQAASIALNGAQEPQKSLHQIQGKSVD